MTTHSHRRAPLTYSGLVRKGGRVALPPTLFEFSLGQRIYFYVKGSEIGFQATPRRVIRGRLLSSRVCRVVRTLTTYGPRARDANRVCFRPMTCPASPRH